MNTFASVFLILCVTAAAPIYAQQLPWPNQDPDQWGIAVLDVETTGLDPAYHEMIDLGVIYIDLEGNELARFFSRIKPDHPERAGDVARSINGFDVKRWEQLEAFPEALAVEQFIAFHNQYKGQRNWIVLAYNAYFDRNFLDALLKEHGYSFREMYSYFVLDVPSMAWGSGIVNLQPAQVAIELGIEPETRDPLMHTGLSGAEFNLELYKALRERASH